MRKQICILLVLVLAVGLCAPAALAAGTPTVSISSGTVDPGGEVTLTVSMQDNPGVTAIMVYIYYDTSVFSVDPERDIQAAGPFHAEGGLLGNTIAASKKVGRFDGDQTQDGVLALWYNSSGLNSTCSGDVLTATLHANASAQPGSYTIGLGYSPRNTTDLYGKKVAVSTVPGTVTVSGSGGQATPVKPGPGGKPGSGSTAGPDDTAVLFSDIAGNWAEEYIKKAAERKLVVGDAGKYRPQDSMTRAELVTILWRANGSPKAKPSTFTDLTQDWYKEAVAWAQETGVVNGVGYGQFAPTSPVSREQLATILHRMAGSPRGMEGMLTGLYDQKFTDSGKLSGWAKASVYWTYYTEILCGNERLTVEGELAPQASATRAQIAVMIVRYLDRMEKGE